LVLIHLEFVKPGGPYLCPLLKENAFFTVTIIYKCIKCKLLVKNIYISDILIRFNGESGGQIPCEI
ncbi:MAG: hypothetical protein KAR32_07265, partial [Candidatus Omnitrophica bacterium]|nr:hypothetical protein [Candidatus Omnitrophota bacterium]